MELLVVAVVKVVCFEDTDVVESLLNDDVLLEGVVVVVDGVSECVVETVETVVELERLEVDEVFLDVED